MTAPDPAALETARQTAQAMLEAREVPTDSVEIQSSGSHALNARGLPASMDPSALLDDDLKDQVMAEFETGLREGPVSMMVDAEDKKDPLSGAIGNKDRDALINRLMDLFFKNASAETRQMICGPDYPAKRGSYKFWTEVASIGLSSLPLFAGVIAVAALPATIAAVALTLARYSQDAICTVKMPGPVQPGAS